MRCVGGEVAKLSCHPSVLTVVLNAIAHQEHHVRGYLLREEVSVSRNTENKGDCLRCFIHDLRTMSYRSQSMLASNHRKLLAFYSARQRLDQTWYILLM